MWPIVLGDRTVIFWLNLCIRVQCAWNKSVKRTEHSSCLVFTAHDLYFFKTVKRFSFCLFFTERANVNPKDQITLKLPSLHSFQWVYQGYLCKIFIAFSAPCAFETTTTIRLSSHPIYPTPSLSDTAGSLYKAIWNHFLEKCNTSKVNLDWNCFWEAKGCFWIPVLYVQ